MKVNKKKKMNPREEAALELRWVLITAFIAVALASIPYIWGALIAPPGTHFTGLTHNIDDAAVYLSWIQQIVQGSVTYHNLYAPALGQGEQFNLLILIMGLVTKVSMLPTVWVFHAFRIGLGMLLVWLAWRFSFHFTDNRAERKLFVMLLCFSSGVGWLLGPAKAGVGAVDMWQPEAITFLSVYLNPLFLAGLVLMLATVHFLIQANNTGSYKHAAYAGACLLVLANVHTYDVIPVGALWLGWFLVSSVIARSINTKALVAGLIAAAVSIPALVYQYHLYTIDPTFSARANTVISSPSVISYLLGFGLIALGAVAGLFVVYKRLNQSGRSILILPVLWAVIGIAVAYLPVAQQRKLIMGVHIPLCLLCVLGISWIIAKLPAKNQFFGLLIFIILAVQSNAAFLKNDILLLGELKTVTIFPAYLTNGQLQSIDYIKSNTSKGDTIFASPTISLFVPAIAGRGVYYGHWSETPDYQSGILKWRQFTDRDLAVQARRAIWLSTGAQYYISESDQTLPPAQMLLEEARQVYQSGDCRVFKLTK